MLKRIFAKKLLSKILNNRKINILIYNFVRNNILNDILENDKFCNNCGYDLTIKEEKYDYTQLIKYYKRKLVDYDAMKEIQGYKTYASDTKLIKNK